MAGEKLGGVASPRTVVIEGELPGREDKVERPGRGIEEADLRIGEPVGAGEAVLEEEVDGTGHPGDEGWWRRVGPAATWWSGAHRG